MASTQVFKFTVKPDRRLARNLRWLPQDVRRKIGRMALRQGAKRLVEAVKDEMQSQDIRRTGEGIESIGHTIRLDKLYKDELRAEIGPISPLGWYLHFIEFGTGPRVTDKGKSTGMVPAKPFMEPAFNATVDEIQNLIAGVLRTQIAKRASA